MFSNKLKPSRAVMSVVLEALQEPAFGFDPEKALAYSNAAGQEFLRNVLPDPESSPNRHDAFRELFRYLGAENEKPFFPVNGCVYDITESAIGEEILLRLIPRRLDEHILRLSSALDVMPWGLISVDLIEPAGTVLFCNKRAGDLLQASHADMKGLPVRDVLRVFGVEEDIQSLVFSGTSGHYDHETRLDGRAHWYRIHFIPNPGPQPSCLLVIDETTDAKVMEGQYFQAQRLEALGQLAGGVAHDFNNILSIIDGYARMARKSVPDKPEAVGYMEHIGKAVQRGAALTSQLLTFGRHKISKEKIIDLGALVRDQEPLLRPLMDASIALSIKAEQNVMVEVPPDDICQILMNLCINARDAMPDGGNLVIDVRRLPGDQALMEIMDTGTGMTPEVKQRIFDPFYTTKEQGKGTGLGLSMVYGLVKDMRGQIEVHTRPGSGSIFAIRLPLSAKKADISDDDDQDDETMRMEGLTALIAEDEPDLLNLVSGMMEEMGIKVLKASNGNEALMIQQDYEGDIDFLLTDVVMPELNGVRLAELFGACRPASQVMFMSGYPANGQMVRVPIPEGAFLMSKPVDFEKLRGLVKSVIGGKKGNRTQGGWNAGINRWRPA